MGWHLEASQVRSWWNQLVACDVSCESKTWLDISNFFSLGKLATMTHPRNSGWTHLEVETASFQSRFREGPIHKSQKSRNQKADVSSVLMESSWNWYCPALRTKHPCINTRFWSVTVMIFVVQHKNTYYTWLLTFMILMNDNPFSLSINICQYLD